MNIEIGRVPSESSSLLANLVQYYIYDFSDVVDLDVSPDGTFAHGLLDGYWDDPSRHAFLARVGGKAAGFALVRQGSRVAAERARANVRAWEVAEFFVMRKYRRRGVGLAFATHLFDSFPGKWEVRQRSANEAATRFWRSVIAGYTTGLFEETVRDDDGWRGPVQTFDNSVV